MNIFHTLANFFSICKYIVLRSKTKMLKFYSSFKINARKRITLSFIINTVLTVVIVKCAWFYLYPILSPHIHWLVLNIMEGLHYAITRLFFLLIELAIFSMNDSISYMNNPGSSSRDITKLGPIYGERKNPYDKDKLNELYHEEKNQEDKGKGKDKGKGVEGRADRPYKECANPSLSKYYISDPGIGPRADNDLFNPESGDYRHNSYFGHDPKVLRDLLYDYKSTTIGFETSNFKYLDKTSLIGHSAPVYHMQGIVPVSNFHNYQLPNIVYNPYGNLAPTYDPKFSESKAALAQELDRLGDFHPNSLNSYKQLAVLLETQRSYVEELNMEFLKERQYNRGTAGLIEEAYWQEKSKFNEALQAFKTFSIRHPEYYDSWMRLAPEQRHNISDANRDNPRAAWRYFYEGFLGFNPRFCDVNGPRPTYFAKGTFLEFLIHHEISKPILDHNMPSRRNNYTVNGEWHGALDKEWIKEIFLKGPNLGVPENQIISPFSRIILVNIAGEVIADVSTVNSQLPKGVTVLQMDGDILAHPEGTFKWTFNRLAHVGQRSHIIRDQTGLIISDLMIPGKRFKEINLKYHPFYAIYKERDSVTAGAIFVPTNSSEIKGFVGSNRKLYSEPYGQRGIERTITQSNLVSQRNASLAIPSSSRVIDITDDITPQDNTNNNLNKGKKRVRFEEPGESSQSNKRRK